MATKKQLAAIGMGVKFLHNNQECVLDPNIHAGSLKMGVKCVKSGESFLLPHNTKVLIDYDIEDMDQHFKTDLDVDLEEAFVAGKEELNKKEEEDRFDIEDIEYANEAWEIRQAEKEDLE